MSLRRNLELDEAGQEPIVMKILVGIILVAIGLGIGVTVYQKFGGAATSYLDYDVSVTPGADTSSIGESEVVEVDVRTNVGFEEEVNLTATGVPEDVQVNFSPSDGVPTFGSTMNVNLLEGAPLGTHTITVKANSGDMEKTATYKLTIEQ